MVVHRGDTLEIRLWFDPRGPRADSWFCATAMRSAWPSRRTAGESRRAAASGCASGRPPTVGALSGRSGPTRTRSRPCRLSADGRRLLTAGDDGAAKVWDISGGEARLLSQPDHPDAAKVPRPVTAAAFSPADPRVFAVGRDDGAIELWNPERNMRPWPIGPRGGEVQDAGLLAGRPPAGRRGRRPADHDRPHRPARTSASRWPPATTTAPGPIISSGSMPWPFGPKAVSWPAPAMTRTIRLWRLGDRGGSLLGTLAGSNNGWNGSSSPPTGSSTGSAAGERRVTWRLDPRWWAGEGDGLIARLDQLGRHFRVDDLADNLLAGQDARGTAPGLAGPPRPGHPRARRRAGAQATRGRPASPAQRPEDRPEALS